MTRYALCSDASDEELDESANLSGMGSIDPFDFVYSNLPDSKHILKKVPDCKHCKAKKFERETDGFCCLNGQVKLIDRKSVV